MFDGYRAYAILGIVVLHVLGVSGVLGAAGGNSLGIVVWGTLGQFVDILFIISGFVVYLPTVARQGNFGSVGAYAIRRAARLLPAYWLMLAISLFLLAVVSVRAPLPFPAASSIGLHVAALQAPATMFQHNFLIGFGIDGPVWTLSLEVAFYLILPFVAAWYFQRPWLGLVIAAVVAVTWKEAFDHLATLASTLGIHPSPTTLFQLRAAADIQFPAWAFSFGLGMTGAWTYVRLRARHEPKTLARRVLPVQALSLMALGLFVYLTGRYAATAPLLTVAEYSRRAPILALGYSASLATFMVATALGSPRLQKPFAHPFARWLGDISYGIFLFHALIVTYAFRLFSLPFDGSLGAFAAWSAIVIPPSVLYGYLSARLLEQPVRRWARRYGRRQAGGGELPARASAGS